MKNYIETANPSSGLIQDIKNLVLQPNYPCISAVNSFLKNEYLVSNFSDFGSGTSAAGLYEGLIHFKNEQRRLKAPNYSFWAVYDGSFAADEDDFEKKLWSELSAVHAYEVDLCRKQNRDFHWDPKFSSHPDDKNFCFSLDGSAYFVVGLHPKASRKARQFKYPVLIFNLYSQFEELFEKNTFEPMVNLNRKREIKFQGNINPMVEKHGQDWESIQFSGKNNPDQWKCPFTRFMNMVKW